jgi:O-antigen/teichoic acid export membrane protein
VRQLEDLNPDMAATFGDEGETVQSVVDNAVSIGGTENVEQERALSDQVIEHPQPENIGMPLTGILGFLSALDSQGWWARTSIQSMLGKTTELVGSHRGFLALCDQGVVSVTNFATAVIIGRACGKAELGAYTLAWTLMTLATEISAVLTTAPYTVFGPRLGRSRRRRYLGSVLMHQLLLAMMFALTMAAGAVLGSWQGWLPDSVSTVVTTTGAVILFISLRDFVRRVSFAELRIGVALLVDVTACLAQAVGVLLLLHFGALTASRTYTVLGISSAVAAGGWLAIHRGAFRSETRFYVQDFQRNWRFAKWVLASCVLSVSARYLYPWVLAAFHGTAVTGTWAACVAIVALGNPVLLGLGNYVGPKISNVYAISGIAAMQRNVYRWSMLFTVLLLPIVLVLAGFGDRIVTRVYGNAYAGSAGVVLLLALNMLIGALVYPYCCGLYALECSKADMLINLVAVTLLFTIGIVAVKSYAALGAAATLLVSSSVTTVIRITIFAREVRRHP